MLCLCQSELKALGSGRLWNPTLFVDVRAQAETDLHMGMSVRFLCDVEATRYLRATYLRPGEIGS